MKTQPIIKAILSDLCRNNQVNKDAEPILHIQEILQTRIDKGELNLANITEKIRAFNDIDSHIKQLLEVGKLEIYIPKLVSATEPLSVFEEATSQTVKEVKKEIKKLIDTEAEVSKTTRISIDELALKRKIKELCKRAAEVEPSIKAIELYSNVIKYYDTVPKYIPTKEIKIQEEPKTQTSFLEELNNED